MTPTHSPPGQRDPPVLERLRTALAGRYELLGEIGRGGMATVYLARDTRHAREVAVKVLHPDFATALTAERFLFEINTAARLLHPHILGLIDSGDADGLLYYIMPHVRGESLRVRLERERRIPPRETARLGCEVASALDHAHGMGIVHRDIKPDNILLADGAHVLVADFGLARAILQATDHRLTFSRHIVGTVLYISPEQATGTATVDGRSDIYSLGCVLFEMLCGTPPFVADPAADDAERAMIYQHVVERAPKVCARCPDVPVELGAVVDRALATDPAQRFQDAGAMAQALDRARAAIDDGSSSGIVGWTRRHARGLRRAAAGVAVAAGVALLASLLLSTSVTAWLEARFTPQLDTARYAIVPFQRAAGAPAELAPELMLHDAMGRWNGVELVEQLQVQDALARSGAAGLETSDAQRIARRFGAGRFVWGEVARLGDSIRVHASLYDARDGTLIASKTMKVSAATLASAAPFEELADGLLFRGAEAAGRDSSSAGTTSYAARSAYLRGRIALLDWNLAAADSALTEAVAADPEFAAASLWLGYVRGWMTDSPAGWRAIAGQAVAGRAKLTAHDRILADALFALATADYPTACSLYRRLKASDPRDFTATYGLGECVRRDSAVVRDPRSPSGWRFRGSRHRAVNEYATAFELLPSVHKAFRERAFSRIRSMLLTETTIRVDGRALSPDTTTFTAAPSWFGDTLALIPYPKQLVVANPSAGVSATAVDAVNHQRALFRDIAASWRQALPDEVEPLEAMALALEMLGDSTALDTLRRARVLAVADDQRLRLAVQEVWLLVKLGLPDDLTRLAAARGLADSVVAADANAEGPSAELVAGLAILTGHAHLAAALARRGAEPMPSAGAVPLRITAASRALVVYAAVGGPVDSLRALETRIRSDIRNTIAMDRQDALLVQMLARAAGLAFPVFAFQSLPELAGQGNALLDAQFALQRGDSVRARSLFVETRKARSARRAADLTLDVTYASAWTLTALGNRSEALAWLDPVLSAAPLYPPQSLTRLANAGALMRAMLLRAELAQARGDRAGARRWMRPLLLLWQRADPYLKATVRLAPTP